MARYSIGIASNATTTLSAVRAEIRANTGRPRLMELMISNEAATQQLVMVGRALAIGVTPTSPKTLLDEISYPIAALTTTAIAWGTAPTLPTEPLRRFQLTAVVGAAVILTFGPSGLFIPTTGSIIVWNGSASSSALLGITAVVEE